MARLNLAVVILVGVVFICLGEETSAYKEYKKKYSSKDKVKLAQWLKQKKKSPFQKTKGGGLLTPGGKFDEPPEPEDKEEGKRICQALSDESLPDFFMKFGLVTSLIDDVSSFKRQMKDQGPQSEWQQRKKRLEDKDDYSQKKLLKASRRRADRRGDFLKGKGEFGSKRGYYYGKMRAREDREYMPPCYGFNYLTAVDALMADEESGGPPVPDPMELRDLLSDLTDMKLSDKLAEIVDSCAGKDKKKTCPKLQKKPLVKLPADCVDRCSSDGDCAEGELCCDTSCGGRACLDPEAKPAKYRSDNGGAAKCQVADKYMQCVYDSIKNQVCPYN